MKDFDANTYKTAKGDFNSEDENLLLSLLIQNQNIKTILDIGCGDGKLSSKVKNNFPESEMVAIDNSDQQIAMAIGNQNNICFQLIDIIDYSDERKFDCIFSFYAFPHIPKSKLPAALQATKNLLKNGSFFYLFTNICLFDTSLAKQDDQEACDIVFLNNWPSQINLVNMNEMLDMFKNAGFEVVQDKKLKTGATVKDYGDMISWMFILK